MLSFGPVLHTSADYFHRDLLLGMPNYRISLSSEQMLDRQADRYTDGLRQTDRQTGGINPWLWSRKQCQMLLVMSTYNHFVRHDSLRTSKYILYTRVKSVALTCSQTSHRVSAQGMSDDNNCTKRYSGGHVYCENTHTHHHPHIHTLSLHILHGGFDFQAIR